MGNLTSNLTIRLVDDVSGRAKQMAGQLGHIGSELKKLDQIDVFRKSLAGFNEARSKMRAAQKQVEELARQFAAAKKAAESLGTAEAIKQMTALGRAYERAQKQVSSAARAFDQQKNAVLGAKSALSSSGLQVSRLTSEQGRLAAAVERANQRMERQARIASVFRGAGGVIGGIGAGYAAKRVGQKAVVSAAEFDIGVRKQRAFTDISTADQNEILVPQAKRIGQDTQFSNLDVVKAQTKAMQGLPSSISGRAKAQVAAGILEHVKNYALTMEADLETSAEAIRSYLQTTGQDISTPAKAVASSQRATNQLVKMAKLGGMSDEDVQGYLKFAAASGTAVGLTPESMMAIAALARRGELRGDEAGVFMRATAGKLASPTKGGLTAMNSAGIRYADFVRMPGSLDANRFESQFKNDLGMGFTPAVRASLSSILANPDIISDRGRFTAAVTGAVQPLFPATKKGGMSAASRSKVAKSAGAFYKTSAESVDAEGLLDALMASPLTLAQLNEIVTGKHGGKFAITQRQRDEYVSSRDQLRAAGDDPDFAKKKADEIMGGLGGSFERLKGSVENLILSIGTANESFLKFGMDKAGAVLDALSSLPEPVQRVATAFGALGGAWAGFRGLKGLMGGFGLTASATALDGAAGALTAAAGRLGFTGATTAATAAAGVTGARAGLLARMGSRFIPGVGWVILGAGAAYGLWNGEGAVDPGDAEARRGAAADIARRWGKRTSTPGLGNVGPGLLNFGPDLDLTTSKAHEASQLLDELSTPRKAALDASDIQRTIALVDTLLIKLAQVPQAARSVASAVSSEMSREARASMRSLYSDYGTETG